MEGWYEVGKLKTGESIYCTEKEKKIVDIEEKEEWENKLGEICCLIPPDVSIISISQIISKYRKGITKTAETICKECKLPFKHSFKIKRVRCDSCWKEINEREKRCLIEKREREEEELRCSLQDGSNAPAYIKLKALKKFITTKQRKELAEMPYTDFLNTKYWKIIQKYKLYTVGYQCQLCNSKKQTLHIHHKTYEHRGSEYLFLNDLIVLCEKCHQKYHNIKEVV